MRHLTGKVSSRFKAAGPNLATVEGLILERTGLPSMAPGTLNVSLPHDYIVQADAAIEPHEYIYHERLKLQRCRVRGHRMYIMRPESHEQSGGLGANVLELISSIPLRIQWGVKDDDQLTVEVEGDEKWWAAPEPAAEDAA
jgi:hypothetical protein